MKHLIYFMSFLVSLTLVSCENDVVFEENKSIDMAVWKENEPVKFEFEVKDTVTLHNFYINVRNTEAYEYRNLYVFVEIEAPNGKKFTDTVECYLADETGRWLGCGMMGGLYDNRFLYQQKKMFPLSGRYDVNIYQAMRTKELKGIHDVGFCLTNSIK